MEYKVEESRIHLTVLVKCWSQRNREDLFTIYISSTFPETQSTGEL